MSRVRRTAQVFPSRGLSKFVTALMLREAPTVVDLGPAVGANVTFLGERLGCKLRIENLLAAKETWLPSPEEDEGDELGDDLDQPLRERALRISSETVDGVLCWDVFDYLDRHGARTLAAEITRVLKPGGVVFLCYRAEQCLLAGSMEYEVIDETTLRYRMSARLGPVPRVWQSRDMTSMFDRLAVADSFLLTNRMREIVLTRSAASA